MKFYTVAATLAICVLSACSSNPSTEVAKPTIEQPKLDAPNTTLPDVVKGAASANHPAEPVVNQAPATPEAAPTKNTTTTRTKKRTRVKTTTEDKTTVKTTVQVEKKTTTVVKPAPVKPAATKPAATKPQSHQSIGDLLNAR